MLRNFAVVFLVVGCVGCERAIDVKGSVYAYDGGGIAAIVGRFENLRPVADAEVTLEFYDSKFPVRTDSSGRFAFGLVHFDYPKTIGVSVAARGFMSDKTEFETQGWNTYVTLLVARKRASSESETNPVRN